MPRLNLARDPWGESQRLTVRVTVKELQALDELVAAWGADRSHALRRAVREAAARARQQHRQALLDALPTLTVAKLRRLATELHIPGRSRMTSRDLRQAVRKVLLR